MGHIVLRLDRVMADRKMSLNELSEKVGVANVNLSKMKNGHISAIRFSTLAAICDVLHNVSRVTYWNTALKNKMNVDEAYADEKGKR